MATHSRIFAWESQWTEEPGGLQSMGSQRVGHDGAGTTVREDAAVKISEEHPWLGADVSPRSGLQWQKHEGLCSVCEGGSVAACALGNSWWWLSR